MTDSERPAPGSALQFKPGQQVWVAGGDGIVRRRVVVDRVRMIIHTDPDDVTKQDTSLEDSCFRTEEAARAAVGDVDVYFRHGSADVR